MVFMKFNTHITNNRTEFSFLNEYYLNKLVEIPFITINLYLKAIRNSNSAVLPFLLTESQKKIKIITELDLKYFKWKV